MLAFLYSFSEPCVLMVAIFMLERYVFFEPACKKQNWIYLGLFGLLLLTTLLKMEPNNIEGIVLLAGGLSVSIARKEHRIRGFFLVLPVFAIASGLLMPVITLPELLGVFSEETMVTYNAIVYTILVFGLIAFYFIGRAWRIEFAKHIQNRKLHKWEKGMLMVAAFLSFMNELVMSFFSSSTMENVKEEDKEFILSYIPNVPFRALVPLYICLSITVFSMTVIVITLVLQGNKRSYYHNQVNDMQFNIIIMMADIVENRDKNTGGHIRRTAKYVEIIAKKMQSLGYYPKELTQEAISDMMIAAPLHDIGKIHVSDLILNKPGKLNDEEYEVMKTHAKAGRELLLHARNHLGEFSYLNVAVDMAGSHHEWWNGKGYPEGKKGEEIPLCARIMAVADVFDALISKRCYKVAMPLEKAYKIIEEEAGSHFDELVVDAFFAASEEIEEALAVFEEQTDACLLSELGIDEAS